MRYGRFCLMSTLLISLEWPERSPTEEPESQRKTAPNLQQQADNFRICLHKIHYVNNSFFPFIHSYRMFSQLQNLYSGFVHFCHSKNDYIKIHNTHFSRPSPTIAILLLSSVHAMSRILPDIGVYSYFNKCSFCVVSQIRIFPDASGGFKKIYIYIYVMSL